ncbi:MAG: hypothetical protein HKN27_03380 [Silicimonas sp.]|nr:hypothetical protein [Silicimonas sp.]
MKYALTIALLMATPASAFLSQNDLIVRSTGGDTFEVPYRGLSGASDFWCAAGDYVIRELNLPVTTKIYRTSSPPRRAGKGVTFSLSSENAKRTGLFILGNPRGVSASFARSLCNNRFVPVDD